MVWSVSRLEENTYRFGLRCIFEELDLLAPGVLGPRLPTSDEWPRDVGETWLHMGTIRMHQGPRKGVVNHECEVHGIRNLFIAGSSVFPTPRSHSPILTIMALAARLAECLQQTIVTG
jgi:choline dehydrogenase-like flavoprotein